MKTFQVNIEGLMGAMFKVFLVMDMIKNIEQPATPLRLLSLLYAFSASVKVACTKFLFHTFRRT